jgi:hypothetical protein
VDIGGGEFEAQFFVINFFTDQDLFNKSITNGFSMALWIKGANPLVAGNIAIANDSTGLPPTHINWLVDAVNSRMSFALPTTTIYSANSSLPILQNSKWYRAVVTVGADALVTFYVDSVVSGTPDYTDAISGFTADFINLGKYNSDSTGETAFHGCMHKFCFWKKTLTQEEVTQDYEGVDPCPDDLLIKVNMGSDRINTGSLYCYEINTDTTSGIVEDTFRINLAGQRVTATDKYFVVKGRDNQLFSSRIEET